MNTIQAKAKILIVEDDTDLSELEKYHLENDGFDVLVFNSTKGVEDYLSDVDLIIMDRKLPGGVDGSVFVNYIRDKGVETPVIYVSSKARDSEIEEGFLSGCDDYLRKPFNVKELMFRIKAILKRTNALGMDQVNYKDLVLDLNSRKVYVSGDEVKLTKLEFNLLLYLIKNRNKILYRKVLLRDIWSEYKNVQKRTINVTLNRLKKKIDPDDEKNYIVSIHGIGYKFL